MGIVGAIPARYASTRLPGKPLVPIAGRPMIDGHGHHQAVILRILLERPTPLGEAAPAEAAAAPGLTDLQEEVVAISKRLRAAGLQPADRLDQLQKGNPGSRP